MYAEINSGRFHDVSWRKLILPHDNAGSISLQVEHDSVAPHEGAGALYFLASAVAPIGRCCL